MARYLHFTNAEGVEGIKKTNTIWASSYIDGVYAAIVGGAWVPTVQMSSLGRAKLRHSVILFETDFLPDVAFPEEVVWHMPELPIRIIDIITPKQAKKLLTRKIAIDPETEMLKIPLHPEVMNWEDGRKRLPENCAPWVPGISNEKITRAQKIFNESGSMEEVTKFWNAK